MTQNANAFSTRPFRDTLAQNEQAMDSLGLDDFIPKLYERNDTTFTQYTFSENECANFAMSNDGTSRGITSILSLDLVAEESHLRS